MRAKKKDWKTEVEYHLKYKVTHNENSAYTEVEAPQARQAQRKLEQKYFLSFTYLQHF